APILVGEEHGPRAGSGCPHPGALPWLPGAVRSLSGMTSSELKTWQAAKMRSKLAPTLSYLYRPVQRMNQRGFPPDDKLYQITLRTYQDFHHLCMELHYLSCRCGVGRESKE